MTASNSQQPPTSHHKAFFNWTTLRSILTSSGCEGEEGKEFKGFEEIKEVYVSSTFIDAIDRSA
jgi:hypothetical protein